MGKGAEPQNSRIVGIVGTIINTKCENREKIIYGIQGSLTVRNKQIKCQAWKLTSTASDGNKCYTFVSEK